MLVRNVKGKDVAARYGGEEFAVILPDTELGNAGRVAETIRATIERSRLKRADTGDAMGRITVSIAVTSYVPGEGAHEFLARADAGLYQAKNGGRNRTVVLRPPEGS